MLDRRRVVEADMRKWHDFWWLYAVAFLTVLPWTLLRWPIPLLLLSVAALLVLGLLPRTAALLVPERLRNMSVALGRRFESGAASRIPAVACFAVVVAIFATEFRIG
jgi:uncharacterized membrane protein AbrB (regulator of aidB expression)